MNNPYQVIPATNAGPGFRNFTRRRWAITRRWWADVNNNVRWVVSAATLYIILMSACYLYKYLFGEFNYFIAYFRAAFWDDMAQESCAGVKLEHAPFLRLSWGAYFRLCRCLGNEAGFDRQGNLVETFQGFLLYLLSPLGDSPILIIIVLVSLCYAAMWILTYISHILLERYSPAWLWGSLILIPPILHALDAESWLIIGATFTITIMCILFALRYLTVPDAEQGINAGTEATSLFAPLRAILHCILGYVSGVRVNLRSSECVHFTICNCFDALTAANAAAFTRQQDLGFDLERERNDAVICKEEVAQLKIDIQNLTVERDNYRYMVEIPVHNSGGGHLPWALHHTRSRPQSTLTATLAAARSKMVEMASAAENLKIEHRAEVSTLQAVIAKLRSVNKYSQGADEDRAECKDALNDAQALIRAQVKDIREIELKAARLRQALTKEKEDRSEKCKDESGCQRKIQQLEDANEAFRNYQNRNDRFARELAMQMFGMDHTNTEHIDIRNLLNDVAIKWIAAAGRGEPGLNTTDLQVQLIRDQVAEDMQYKDRLERELMRIGGDVTGVRMGLDMARPQEWKVETFTYEQNQRRVFSFYEQLNDTVISLYKLVSGYAVFAPEQVPVWMLEPARHDATVQNTNFDGTFTVPTLRSPGTTNQLINPAALHEDELRRKLVTAECLRWYNRGLQLQTYLRRIIKNDTCAARLSTDGQEQTIRDMLNQVHQVLRTVLHNVLMENCMVKHDETDTKPTPREKKRFEIYTAMQQTIVALTQAIIDNYQHPPPWPVPPPIDNTPMTQPDALARQLIIQEVITLENRIRQLIQFMIDFHIPGTLYGPMQANIQGDGGKYLRNWNRTVAALTFSDLTLNHWDIWKLQKPVLLLDESGIVVVNDRGEPQCQKPVIQFNPLPLRWGDYMEAIKLKNAEVKEADKDKWPEDLVPEVYRDPTMGPRIRFITQSAYAAKVKEKELELEKEINKDENNKNAKGGNDNQTDINAARNIFEVNKKRLEQLTNHVKGWKIQGNTKLPAINQMAKNASLQIINKGIAEQKKGIERLIAIMGNKKRTVPKEPKNGGPMHP